MKKIFNWLWRGRLKPVVLDAEKLNEKAQEYAMKGALSVIEEYYTGYNSVFKKTLTEQLKKMEVTWRMELPDIMALINDSLSVEITKIANAAIAQNFVPLINSFLTRAEKKMKFSDVLREFIKCVEPSDIYDCECEIEKKDDGSFSHRYPVLRHKEDVWKLNFIRYDHAVNSTKGYSFTELPRKNEGKDRYAPLATMKVMVGDVKIEMPFVKEVLSDPFTAFCARLIMSGTEITFDQEHFDEDMIERDHCTC